MSRALARSQFAAPVFGIKAKLIRARGERPLEFAAPVFGIKAKQRASAFERSLGCSLDKVASCWEIPKMNAIKVDDANRLRLPMVAPGDYYVAEEAGTEDIILHKVQPPRRHISVEQARKNFAKSKLKFTIGWDEAKTFLR